MTDEAANTGGGWSRARIGAAITLAIALSYAAVTAPLHADPGLAQGPVDIAWSQLFPFGTQFSLVLGDSRLLVIEPSRVTARAWTDGSPLWNRDFEMTALPVADEGRVFVAADANLIALSEVSGHEEWRLQTGVVTVSPVARAGWVVVAGGDGRLRAISAADGRLIWQHALPAPIAAPLVIDAGLIVGAFEDGSVTAWRIVDGVRQWTTPLGTRIAQLLATYGRVFIGGVDGRLISLRQRDGRKDWEYRLDMPIVGRLAADARYVYVATIDNSVRAHNYNGHMRWRQTLNARVVDGLVADTDRIFVPQSSGEIAIFLADAGHRAGHLDAPADAPTVLGGLVTSGSGADLRMAITTSGKSDLTVWGYRRAGLAAVVATSAPGTLVPLLPPPGRPTARPPVGVRLRESPPASVPNTTGGGTGAPAR